MTRMRHLQVNTLSMIASADRVLHGATKTAIDTNVTARAHQKRNP